MSFIFSAPIFIRLKFRQCHSGGADKFVVIANKCTFRISRRQFKTPGRQMHAIRTSTIYTVPPKKVTHCQIIKKSYYISLKPTDEIRFLCQIKVSVKHYLCVTYFVTSLTMSDPQSCNRHHIW